MDVSVLDLSGVREGGSSRDALNDTVALASAADRLGYRRFWVAEHHNMPAVASTSPAVLIARLGAVTERIRLGSGGVMLPNHAPFVIAEQFEMLEAMFPNRIDLGLGRAPGTDPRTAAALRRDLSRESVDDFPRNVATLMGWFGDERTRGDDSLRPTPAPLSHPSIWILGSSLFGAQLAAAYGLPFSFANHFQALTAATARQAAEEYRSKFQPSPWLDAPHFMVSASALVADTTEQAEFEAGPSRVSALRIRQGRPAPIVSPEQAAAMEMSAEESLILDSMPGTQYAGTADEVTAGLRSLVASLEADELMVTATSYGVEPRIRTLEALAPLVA